MKKTLLVALLLPLLAACGMNADPLPGPVDPKTALLNQLDTEEQTARTAYDTVDKKVGPQETITKNAENTLNAMYSERTVADAAVKNVLADKQCVIKYGRRCDKPVALPAAAK